MNLRNTAFALCALIPATALAACGDEKKDTNEGFATVTGRLEAANAAGGSASVMAVGDDGRLTLAGSGTVAINGDYEVNNVIGGDGPFVVQISNGTAVVAEVIVPQDLDDGDEVTAMPAHAETTHEADVLVAIVPSAGGADAVDSIGLATWIDAELAASGEGSAATLGQAYLQAQAGFVGVINAQDNTEVTVAELTEAKVSAFAELAVALDNASSAAATEAAWASFHTAVSSDIRADLDVDSDAQSNATAAAGFLFTAALSGSADLAHDANRVSAVLSARADLIAQRESAAGSSVQAQVQTELDAAYEGFFDAAAAATTEAELQAAWGVLATRVTGSGAVTFDSVLGILVAGEGADDEQAMEDAVNAIGATAGPSASLEAKLDAALEGQANARATAVAEAYASFQREVDASIAVGELSTRVEAFAGDVANQIGGHGSVILGVDVSAYLGGFVLGGLDLRGSVLAGLGIQSGADGAYGDSDFAIDAISAVLVSVGVDGSTTIVQEGEVEGTTWSFDNLTEVGGTLVVQLKDASGAITGAVILDGNTQGDVQVPELTEETTIESRVWLDIATREATNMIDRASIELLIDAAIAANTETTDDVRTLALAVEAAAAVRAEILGAEASEMNAASVAAMTELHAKLDTRGEAAEAAFVNFRADVEAAVRTATGASEEVYDRAQLEAAVVFAAVVEAGAGADSDLDNAAEARSRIEAALALQGSVGSAFEGSAFAGGETDVAVAVEAFIDATASANNQAGLDAAAEAFVGTLIDVQDEGSVMGGVLVELGIAVQAALEGIIDGSFAAGAAFHTTLDAAVSGAASGALDVSAVVTANAAASTLFAGTIDLTTLLWVDADDEATTTLLTYLALGFQGANAE